MACIVWPELTMGSLCWAVEAVRRWGSLSFYMRLELVFSCHSPRSGTVPLPFVPHPRPHTQTTVFKLRV